MAYHIDAENVSLDALRERIEGTDLVPSRTPLLDGIRMRVQMFEQHGITTLADLRHQLKTPKRRETLSNVTGIDMQYLILLRREIESYFPKPVALKDFDGLPQQDIAKLEEAGIRDTAALYNAARDVESRSELVQSTGIDRSVLDTLAQLADLTRVQWVSAKLAAMLMEADYDSAAKVAAADAENLYAALIRVNEGDRFFKGKIGLRDIKRLVRAAGYVSRASKGK